MRYIRAAGVRDQRSTPNAIDWRSNTVACRGTDTNVFFDETKAGIAAAKAICDTCGWLKECREYALTAPERYGVFGGMDADERKDERRNQWRRAHAAKSRKVVAAEPTATRITTKQTTTPLKSQAETQALPERVDATGTRRRLQALAVVGHGVRAIAARMNQGHASYLSDMRNRNRPTVLTAVALEVARVYPMLLTTPVSVSANDAARSTAAAEGWVGPEAWQGVDIDDPAAKPRAKEGAAA